MISYELVYYVMGFVKLAWKAGRGEQADEVELFQESSNERNIYGKYSRRIIIRGWGYG